MNKNNPEWYFMDAKDKILGKVAVDIVTKLTGKNKPEYQPYMNTGAKVVVTNAESIAVTGKKSTEKIYYRHTGFPGGLKSETLGTLLNRKPTDVLRKAVSGMLPKNKLRKIRLANLYIYPGEQHPHQAQIKDAKK